MYIPCLVYWFPVAVVVAVLALDDEEAAR